MPRTSTLLSTLALAAGLVASAPAFAQATWNYASFSQTTAGTGSYGVGNVYSATSSTAPTLKLAVSAYSTGSGSNFAAANIGNHGSGSGFGVRTSGETTTSPNHAMDNQGGTELLALSFTNASNTAANVVLTSLTSGWHSGDSDLSLLRWSGAAAPGAIAGKSMSTLLTSGWELVNHYANLGDDVARPTGLTTSSSGSSWWMISAYNSSWGAGSSTSGLSNGDDFVKLLASVSAIPVVKDGKLPEPGSLALAAGALCGLFVMRRRKAG